MNASGIRVQFNIQWFYILLLRIPNKPTESNQIQLITVYPITELSLVLLQVGIQELFRGREINRTQLNERSSIPNIKEAKFLTIFFGLALPNYEDGGNQNQMFQFLFFSLAFSMFCFCFFPRSIRGWCRVPFFHVQIHFSIFGGLFVFLSSTFCSCFIFFLFSHLACEHRLPIPFLQDFYPDFFVWSPLN